MKKHNSRSFKSHGEIGSIAEILVSTELPELQEKLKNYRMNDVLNADEFGLFIKCLPLKHCTSPCFWNEKQTERITCLACCNGDGSEKKCHY